MLARLCEQHRDTIYQGAIQRSYNSQSASIQADSSSGEPAFLFANDKKKELCMKTFILENIHIKGPDFIDWWTVVEVPTTKEENQ